MHGRRRKFNYDLVTACKNEDCGSYAFFVCFCFDTSFFLVSSVFSIQFYIRCVVVINLIT